MIIGIETSCDETAVSIYNNKKKFISEYIYTQKIHKKFGGTIPELSSKENIKNLINIIIYTIKKAKISINEISKLSYTNGPGLKNSLIVGTSVGKSISYSLKIPCIRINHLEAHIIISLLFNKKINYPCLVILISGAHTMILMLKNNNEIKLIEESNDDSIGEVFDKIARFLNLNPNNGSAIEKAVNYRKFYKTIKFSKTNIKEKKLSFSGIKTSTINLIKKDLIKKEIICYNFQNEIIKIINFKCKNFIKKHFIKNVIISGGVASNKELRLSLKETLLNLNAKLLIFPKRYCTDNGSMIAFLGFLKNYEGFKEKNLLLKINQNLKLKE